MCSSLEIGGIGVATQSEHYVFYGSKAQPEIVFGTDSPELGAFYQAAGEMAPGACELLNELLDAWQDFALIHCWQLPDGFEARVKAMKPMEIRIEVDELEHATFTHYFKVNEGCAKHTSGAKSLAANVVHSVDAYVLRCIHRLCNYDPIMVSTAHATLVAEQQKRAGLGVQEEVVEGTGIHYYVSLWEKTNIPDVVILPTVIEEGAASIPDALLVELIKMTEKMLSYKAFPVVTIHDEFKCHPNNMGVLRWWYREIMAKLAESTLLDYVFSEIWGEEVGYQKLSDQLPALIRNSRYAIC